VTPFELLVQSLEVERCRPVPPPPDLALFRPVVTVMAPFEVARLVAAVEPRIDAGERARRQRLRNHSQHRARVLSDDEIEAI
jgi:hypothetical protein